MFIPNTFLLHGGMQTVRIYYRNWYIRIKAGRREEREKSDSGKPRATNRYKSFIPAHKFGTKSQDIYFKSLFIFFNSTLFRCVPFPWKFHDSFCCCIVWVFLQRNVWYISWYISSHVCLKKFSVSVLCTTALPHPSPSVISRPRLLAAVLLGKTRLLSAARMAVLSYKSCFITEVTRYMSHGFLNHTRWR